MSASSIFRAANDRDLIERVTSLAHKEVQASEELAATRFGQALIQGLSNVTPLMWGVAVDYEDEYETAINSGRGAPGHDQDVITDANISAAVVAHWPPDPVTIP